MNASVFALLCVAALALNLRQPQQAFLASFGDDADVFASAYLSQAVLIEGALISQMYPDNADQVRAELQECQDQNVKLLPSVIKGVVANMADFLQICIGGNVIEVLVKIIEDSMSTLRGVSAGCPNMTVNIGADLDQLSATFSAQTLEDLLMGTQPGTEQVLIGGKVAGADEATFQKTGKDTEMALSAIHEAFVAAQAGNLTPDQLTAVLNDSLLVASDSGAAFTDVTSDGMEKAVKIASTGCSFVSSIAALVQGKEVTKAE